MAKQEEFLWIVQTTLLAHCVNLATHPENQNSETRHNSAHMFSGAGIHGLAGDAVAASKRIPSDMPVRQAANEFCGFMTETWREEGATCPYWFAELNERLIPLSPGPHHVVTGDPRWRRT